LLIPFFTNAQTVFSGKIVNKINQENIPFATVGLVRENVGTTALEDGSFILVSTNTKPNDTLIFTSIGYKPLKLPVANNDLKNIVIEMAEEAPILSEVIVVNKTTGIYKSLNEFATCGNNFVGTNGYTTQLAQHFQAPVDNAMLTEIKICRMSTAILDPEKTIFRIRIYDMDSSSKSPFTDLCNQVIEVKTRSKIINLSLEKYKIRIPNQDFFVAIEWLKIPYNEHKIKIKIKGKEEEQIYYTPSIGLNENKDGAMKIWGLDYTNKWKIFKTLNTSTISVSATIKY
jgi:hypothetical protein